MISLTLLCLVCATVFIANTAGGQHVNMNPEKNGTDENSVSQQGVSGSEVRPDYPNQVIAIKRIILLFDQGYFLNQYISLTLTSGLFQIVRVLSSLMETMDKRLKMCEEMYKNLSDWMASIRLEVKNLFSVVSPELLSKPPPLQFSSFILLLF